jgi:hypothetical protein
MRKPFATCWYDRRSRDSHSLVFKTAQQALTCAAQLRAFGYNTDIRTIDIRTQQSVTEPKS